MTLPASGTITMSQVNTELGLSATANISLNQAAVRSLFVKPSGAISLNDGHGKSNVTPSVEYLVVAGGGGGGDCDGSFFLAGGGGAGGLLTGTIAVTKGVSNSVSVGLGGAAGSGGNGTNGGNSSFMSFLCYGGGGGGHSIAGGTFGNNGGSGGGGALFNAGGTGVAGQGYSGGGSNGTYSGQGGGALKAGISAISYVGSGEYNGVASSISGTSLNYASGNNPVTNDPGTAGRGTGGQGAGNYAVGAGASGVVIVRYANTYPVAASSPGASYANVAGYHTYTWTSGTGSITL